MQLKQLSFALLTVAAIYCADPAWQRLTENDPIRIRCLEHTNDDMCKDIEALFNLARKTGAEQKNIDPTQSTSTVERITNFPENRFARVVLSQLLHQTKSIPYDPSELALVVMELFAQNATTGTKQQDKLIAKLSNKLVMELMPQQVVALMQMN